MPYEQLKEMDEVNPQFGTTDVVLVIGANDVVNPAARQPGSPISGMPILDVDQAQNVVFLKRSMRPGFAGIDNELLYQPNTTLLFGDAKDSLTKVVNALKSPSPPLARRPLPPPPAILRDARRHAAAEAAQAQDRQSCTGSAALTPRRGSPRTWSSGGRTTATDGGPDPCSARCRIAFAAPRPWLDPRRDPAQGGAG